MQTRRPGEVVEAAPLISELDFAPFRMRVSTDRYHSPEYAARERERLWMRSWQIVGREEELPEVGDWKERSIFDQSFLLVRGRDGIIRGFVNACRHRGNALCAADGKAGGKAARFTCPYHNWSYGLDGQLLAVAKPDFDGTTEEFVGAKEDLGLVQVPVESFAGFIFLNPDRAAEPLSTWLGEAMEQIAPYRVEEMVAHGFHVREALDCNWKVVMDAFQEGYHIQGVHPELVAAMDETQERYRFCGDHSVATAPFGASNVEGVGLEEQADAIRALPATFPAVADSLPRFEELLDARRGADREIKLAEGVTLRSMLQQAMRESWTAKGLDVSALTDRQMSDNHFWILFPNFFMTIHAGEATVIIAEPHPTGDPGRCHWRVINLQWFPPEARAAMRTPLTDVPEGEHYPYFLALEQDYEMMQRQQRGLRNRALTEMALTRQEVRLAHYHAAIDAWVDDGQGRE